MLKLLEVKALTVGTTAETVSVNGRAFMVANNSANALYFKEKAADGVDCSTSNGYLVPAGKTMDEPLVAEKLSLVADDADSDVRVLILDRYA